MTSITCQELENIESATGRTFSNCAVSEKSFQNKTYTRCVFRKINYDNCLFKNVRFIECEFYDVIFDTCKSMKMVFDSSEFENSMIIKSKFNLTTIVKTDFTNFRFYNSIFLDTIFENCNITGTLLENSSFVKTAMLNVIMTSVSMILLDFRNSSFHELYFEYDVDIHKSNFGNCRFDNCHFGSPRITETIFDDSHFSSVVHTDNSKIEDCSFENVVYSNTNVITTSAPRIRINVRWSPVVLDMSESVISLQPQSLSTMTRNYPMISRLFVHGSGGDITHVPISTQRHSNQTVPALEARVPLVRGRRRRRATVTVPNPAPNFRESIQQRRQVATDGPFSSAAPVATNGPFSSAAPVAHADGPFSSAAPVATDGPFSSPAPAPVETSWFTSVFSPVPLPAPAPAPVLRDARTNRFGITNINDISEDQTAFELIDGELPLRKHLRENPDTFVFYFYENYYIAAREDLIRIVSSSTFNEKLNNSIIYECLIADSMSQQNIVLDKPLVKLAALGLPVNGSYLPLQQMMMVINEQRSEMKYRVYEIVDTGKTVQSVISYQALHRNVTGIDYLGASHCQAGQGGRIFKLNKMRNINNMLTNLVSRYKTNKKRRESNAVTGGGDKSRRVRMKKKQTVNTRKRNKSSKKRKNITRR